VKGRKQLPTIIKEAKGTLRPCRINPNEPQYPAVNGLPDPPLFFGEVAKSEYYTTGNILISLGVLKSVNITTLLTYCRAFETYIESQKDIEKHGFYKMVLNEKTGNKVVVVNPFIKIGNDATMIMIRMACELGITPASSSKVVAIKKIKKDSIFD
jgi:P27 family predicted phage terminase small subunit